MEELFMLQAIKQAKMAKQKDEVPVGAVIVKDGKIITRAHNKVEKNKSVTMHAEIQAMQKASKVLNDWRLNNCELYVTLEPCCMCAGAIINSRIKKVVFGAYDANMGCTGSVTNLFKLESLHYKGEIVGGVLKDECLKLITDFFKQKR